MIRLPHFVPYHRGSRIAAAALMTSLLAATAVQADTGAARPADMIAGLLPQVVNIAIVSFERSDARTGNMAAQATTSVRRTQGSGLVIDPSGLIATNRHVIAKADQIAVILNDGTRLQASVLAYAAQTDLALLKVYPDRKLPTVTFGDSDTTRPGDQVYVIGNPLGLGSTVTSGIVSAVDRSNDVSQAVSFIQIDAPLNTGNSGGPVFNADGQVIGIGTALFGPGGDTGSVGLGFAIPVNDAKFVLRRLQENGELRLGWIGAHIQKVGADIATTAGLPEPSGSIVTGIETDSPAAKAGLREGDIILKIDNEVVAETRILNRVIGSSAIGSTLPLTIWRDGAKQVVPVVIAESAADKAAADSTRSEKAPSADRVDRPDLGLAFGSIDRDTRARLGLSPRQAGVLVTNVLVNSVAAEHDLVPGSAILNVAGQPVTSPAEVQARIDRERTDQRSAVLLLVADMQGRRWVSVPLHR